MREKRKTKASEVDIMEPIVDIMLFGSADDPCFGKLNDPTNSICKRCGDAEVCAIVMGQRLHKKRNAQGKFKDDEEPNFDLVTMEKFITSKLAINKHLSFSRIKTLTYKHFSLFEEVDQKYLNKKVYEFVKRSPKYIKFLKDGIKYLKLK